MTKHNTRTTISRQGSGAEKGKLPVICPVHERSAGNLNNSSWQGYLNNRNKRALVSSGLKPNGIGFTIYPSRYPFRDPIRIPAGDRYYTCGPTKENLDWVNEVLNEYDEGAGHPAAAGGRGSNCFYISFSKDRLLGNYATLIFYISLKNEKLLSRLRMALGGCGQILKRNDSFIFTVQDPISINEKIIPIFNKSCLQGKKLEAFERWKKAAPYQKWEYSDGEERDQILLRRSSWKIEWDKKNKT